MKQFLRGVAIVFAKILFATPLSRPLKRGPLFEWALCSLLVPQRMSLPLRDLEALFPGTNSLPIELLNLPKGSWSSPLNDVVHLLKIVRLRQPRRVLELGSFRGWTAYNLARHLPADGKVVAVDVNPEHGEAYLGTALEARIERRVGAITSEMFRDDADGSFDLIFIDADHRYTAARNDTEISLRLVTSGGLIVWHDYANYGYFSGFCGVPEYLKEFSQRHSVVSLEGTNLALWSPAWDLRVDGH